VTPEEQLDRLRERTDAIAQSVELLTHDVRELTVEMRRGFGETLRFINRLAHVAEAHDQRINDLEKGKQ
jgi:hypothetical protein